jgi:hypothetical protein
VGRLFYMLHSDCLEINILSLIVPWWWWLLWLHPLMEDTGLIRQLRPHAGHMEEVCP